MATVNVPAAMRTLTGGEPKVTVSGGTLGEVIENLEAGWPGLKSRLVEGERVRPGLAVFINQEQVHPGLQTRVPEESEIYFAPAMAGG